MNFAIGLVVTVEVDAAHRDAAVDGRLPDGALRGLAVVLERAGTTDVDGHDFGEGHSRISSFPNIGRGTTRVKVFS